MITFSNINNVIDLINHLKIDNSKETETAVSCIKIEQVKAKLTRFKTYEPTVGYYQRDLLEEDKDCFGEEGEIFIVDYIAFKDMLERMSKSVDSQSKLQGLTVPRLTIKHENGMMILHTNLRYTSKGVEESKSTQVLTLYPGQQSDFSKLTPHTKTVIASTSAKDFDKLVKVVSTNGEFTDSNESYSATVNSKGRLVVLSILNDTIKAFTTRKCESVWFEVNKPCYAPAEKQYHLEGRLIDKLKDIHTLGDDINIYSITVSLNINEEEEEEELTLFEWLLFETGAASIACRVLEEKNLAIERKYKFFLDLYEDNQLFGSRIINPLDLKNTFDVMHDKKREASQQLSLFELNDEDTDTPYQFVVLDNKDKLGISNTKFPIIKYNKLDYPAVCFRYSQIDGLSKTLSSYYNLHKTDEQLSPLIELKLMEKEIDCSGTIIIRAIAYAHFEDDRQLLVHCQPTSLEELDD